MLDMSLLNEITLPPILYMATSNDKDVRVLGSKKHLQEPYFESFDCVFYRLK